MKNHRKKKIIVAEDTARYSSRKGEQIFRFGELFCGPGGLALGAQLSSVKKDGNLYRIQHTWASDYNHDSCETYRKNICNDNAESVICTDVRELAIEELPKIDAFAFGFPCNDFSLVGEQKGMNGSYGGLYKFGVKVLKHFKPKFFLAENVGGLRSSNEGKAFEKIMKELWDTGYILYPHFYKFEEYGIPQNRHRIIIVGIREDLNVVFHVPRPFETMR